MSIIIDNILKKATALGACRLTESVTDAESLVRLFFTPQGREFCVGRGFPSLPDFRKLKSEHISYFNVFCDFGSVHHEGGGSVGVVGKTTLEAKFCDNAEELHQIVLMHGAKANIEIGNHAVIHIEKTPDCEVHITNTDNTGIVLW